MTLNVVHFIHSDPTVPIRLCFDLFGYPQFFATYLQPPVWQGPDAEGHRRLILFGPR